jgi:hypothetical protein
LSKKEKNEKKKKEGMEEPKPKLNIFMDVSWCILFLYSAYDMEKGGGD